MNSRYLRLPAALAFAAGCSLAQASAPADVEAFYVQHCAAMVSVVERQSLEDARRFELALAKAVGALRALDRSLGYDTALMRLKVGCDRHLEEAAAGTVRTTTPGTPTAHK